MNILSALLTLLAGFVWLVCDISRAVFAGLCLGNKADINPDDAL